MELIRLGRFILKPKGDKISLSQPLRLNVGPPQQEPCPSGPSNLSIKACQIKSFELRDEARE
jgi:hypothetical protein